MAVIVAAGCGKATPAKKLIDAREDEAVAVQATEVGTDVAKTRWAEQLPAFDGKMHVAADGASRSIAVVVTGTLREATASFGEVVEPVAQGVMVGWKQVTGAEWVRSAEANVEVGGVAVGLAGVLVGGAFDGPWTWRKGRYAKAGAWEVEGQAGLLVTPDGAPDQVFAPGGPADESVIVGGEGIGFHGIVGQPAMQRQRIVSWDGGELTWAIDLAKATPPVQAFEIGKSGDDVAVCVWVGGPAIDLGDGKGARPLVAFSETGGTAAIWIGKAGAVTDVRPLEGGVPPAHACHGFAATRAGVTTTGPAGDGLDLVTREGKRSSLLRGSPTPAAIASDGGDQLLTAGKLAMGADQDIVILRDLARGEELMRFALPAGVTVEDAALSGDLIAIAARTREGLDLGEHTIALPGPFVWALELPVFAR